MANWYSSFLKGYAPEKTIGWRTDIDALLWLKRLACHFLVSTKGACMLVDMICI